MPTPADWQPPYPSFAAAFGPETARVVMAYYGMEKALGETAELRAFEDWMQVAVAAPSGPAVINRARHRDRDGRESEVFILYWTDPNRFAEWEGSGIVTSFWLAPDRLQGRSGYWREVFQPPLSHLETLISSETPAGLAEAKRHIEGPVRAHAYWGAARDRIPHSALDPLESPQATLQRLNRPSTTGARLRIRPPQNLCVIRSGQNWSGCGPEERELYLTDVHPVLIEGMNFLRDNPEETGCISCRFMSQLTPGGVEEEKSFATAYFVSLGHLERWAKSHPTHLAIFGSFHKLVKQRNFALDLKLWHEVAVLPSDMAVCEYINCAPETGLLPYFAAVEF